MNFTPPQSDGTASVSPDSGLNVSMAQGVGTEGNPSLSSSPVTDPNFGHGLEESIDPSSSNAIHSNYTSDNNLASLSLSQLETKQKELEEQVRKYSSKRDYHFASARSAFISGSKTMFNYMAFFNNRGYF